MNRLLQAIPERLTEVLQAHRSFSPQEVARATDGLEPITIAIDTTLSSREAVARLHGLMDEHFPVLGSLTQCHRDPTIVTCWLARLPVTAQVDLVLPTRTRKEALAPDLLGTRALRHFTLWVQCLRDLAKNAPSPQLPSLAKSVLHRDDAADLGQYTALALVLDALTPDLPPALAKQAWHDLKTHQGGDLLCGMQ
jgi:hypothetical protein